MVHTAVNGYRSMKGANPVSRDPGLDKLARQHSEYLRDHQGEFSLYGKNVSHYGFESRSLYAQRLLGMSGVSENVASTSSVGSNPGSVMLGLWVGSKNHEYNMRQSWTHTGIGYVRGSDGTVFCTQIFATKGSEMERSRNRFVMH